MKLKIKIRIKKYCMNQKNRIIKLLKNQKTSQKIIKNKVMKNIQKMKIKEIYDNQKDSLHKNR